MRERTKVLAAPGSPSKSIVLFGTRTNPSSGTPRATETSTSSREVMPEFVDREERHEQARAARLAPVIEQVMARKPAGDHAPLDSEYTIPAYPRLDADADASGKFHRWLDDYAVKVAAGEDVSKRLE